MPGVITEPSCSWGIQIQIPGPPGWGLDAGLTTFLCTKIIVENSESNLAEFCKDGCCSKRDVLMMMIMMDFMMINT
jgi:hypothetical protein